ncbi:DMT family transporter [Alteribacillus iranensis]|uniref:EamA domain-containing membrane protein RarD n=1 Tax=Alteribacillus iranensis TaxID=930128 RepID=A0A1I1ZVK6_9BACI|nr:DMT family transporter [Alteribacillus iranensis]SFE35675.1 EamA domain-containing membrane protein RarD [Alteribacillus iranensis]
MINRDSVWLNYFFVVAVMILWGLNVVALKVLVDHMPPASMQALRVLAAGLVIVVIITWNREWKKLKATEWKYMLIAAGLGVTAHHLLLAYGLTLTSAVNTSLILALVPLTTSILAVLFLGDRLTKWRLFGVLLGFIGVFFINAAGTGSSIGALSIGDIIVFLAMFVQAASFIYIKKATNTVQPRLLTGCMFIAGALGIGMYSVWAEPGGFLRVFEAPLYVWLVFLGSSVFATALGHQLFNRSIQKIGAGETAVFNNLVPFFGLISSAVLLNENVGAAQWIGFIIIVIGVLLGTGYVEQKWFHHRKIAS